MHMNYLSGQSSSKFGWPSSPSEEGLSTGWVTHYNAEEVVEKSFSKVEI